MVLSLVRCCSYYIYEFQNEEGDNFLAAGIKSPSVSDEMLQSIFQKLEEEMNCRWVQ